MRNPALRVLLGATTLLCSAGIPAQAQDPGVPVPVRGIDGSAFEYRMALLRTTPKYRVFRVTYPSPVHTDIESNNTIPADYYLPNGIREGDAPRPAVVCLHILGGNFELVSLLCAVFAERGIPAVMFKLPYYGERAEREVRRTLQTDAGIFAQAIEQAVEDIRRTADFLASRPEVDPDRIGVSGISLGAIVGATACGKVPRLWRAGLILGGGDLRTIIHHARETRGLSNFIKAQPPAEQERIEKLIADMDPLRQGERLRALAQQGRVLMINATDDEVIPRRCTERLAGAAGIADQVVWLEGLAHYTAMAALPGIIDRLGDFFAEDLPKGCLPPAAPPPEQLPPEHRLARLVRDLIALIGPSPGAGRCHLAMLQAEVTEKGKPPQTFDFGLVRGEGERFRLDGTVPKIGKLSIGNGAAPWILARKGTCFVGSIDEGEARPLATFLNPQHLLKARVAWGALSAMTLSPDAFRGFLAVRPEPGGEGSETLRIELSHRYARGTATVVFAKDGTTPETVSFAMNGTTGIVRFRQWQIDTPGTEELFAPPGTTRKPVRREDVQRMFAAVFDAIGENAQ